MKVFYLKSKVKGKRTLDDPIRPTIYEKLPEHDEAVYFYNDDYTECIIAIRVEALPNELKPFLISREEYRTLRRTFVR